MARTLFIRMGSFDLSRPEEATAEWVVADDSGSFLQAQDGRIGELDWPKNIDKVIVVVPTTDVFMTSVSLPGGNRQKLLRAIPYAVEEQIIDDVETLHFSLSEKASGNEYRVIAVDNERMAAWLELLAKVHINPAILVPDVLCLPWQDAEWTLLLEREYSLIRTGQYEGYAFEPDNLAIYLKSLIQQNESNLPRRIQVYSNIPESEINQMLAGIGGDIEVVARQTGHGGMTQFLARGFDTAKIINLLQGRYRQEQNWQRVLRPWYPAAALFVAWFLIQTGMNIVQYQSLSAERDRIESQIEQIFKQTFPGSKIVPGRMKERMQQLTAELRKTSGKGGDSLQQILMLAGPELVRNKGINIKTIQYRDGMLEFELIAKESASIDRLKQTLSRSDKWDIETRTSSKGGRVESQLRIRRKKA